MYNKQPRRGIETTVLYKEVKETSKQRNPLNSLSRLFRGPSETTGRQPGGGVKIIVLYKEIFSLLIKFKQMYNKIV